MTEIKNYSVDSDINYQIQRIETLRWLINTIAIVP